VETESEGGREQGRPKKGLRDAGAKDEEDEEEETEDEAEGLRGHPRRGRHLLRRRRTRQGRRAGG